jgi:hypothetical protein
LVIVQFFYGIGSLGNTGLYYWLRDWEKVFTYFYIIPGAVLIVAIVLIVTDTPIELINNLSPEEAHGQFMKIAKINGVANSELSIDHIRTIKEIELNKHGKEGKEGKEEETDSKRFTFVDVFRYPSLRYLTLLLIILQITINFLFYAPTLMIADFEFDIFINNVIIGSASAGSYIFSYFAITRVKRKTMAVLSFILIFIFSFILIFFWNPNG